MAKMIVYVFLFTCLFGWCPKLSRSLSPYPECNNFLTSSAQDNFNVTEAKNLLKVTLDQALGNATSIFGFIIQLQKQSKDPVFNHLLDTCHNSYKGFVTVYLPEAIGQARIGRYSSYLDINSIVFGNANEVKDCEAGFSEAPIKPRPSPLTARNKLMYELLCTAGSVSKFLMDATPPLSGAD